MQAINTETSSFRSGPDAERRERAQAAVIAHHYALPVVVAVHRQPTAHGYRAARSGGAARPRAGSVR